jgi:hypothetical protein
MKGLLIYDDQIKMNYEMGEAWNIDGRNEKLLQNFSRETRGEALFCKIRGWRIILK